MGSAPHPPSQSTRASPRVSIWGLDIRFHGKKGLFALKSIQNPELHKKNPFRKESTEVQKGDVSCPQPHCGVAAQERSRGRCTAHSGCTCTEPPGMGRRMPGPCTSHRQSLGSFTQGRCKSPRITPEGQGPSRVFCLCHPKHLVSRALRKERGKRGPEQSETRVTSTPSPLARTHVQVAGKQRGAHETLGEHRLPLPCPGPGVPVAPSSPCLASRFWRRKLKSRKDERLGCN